MMRLRCRKNRTISRWHNVKMGEFYALIMSAAIGMTLMASASDLLMFYLAIEMVSITSYILVVYQRGRSRGSEAAMKYVIYGSVASGLMLFGLSIFYGMTGSLSLFELREILTASAIPSTALLVATVFVLAGFGFKISMVPFHNWTPDVYEGASTPVTAFFSVAPKAAGLAVLLRFFFSGLSSMEGGVLRPFYGLDWPFLLGVFCLSLQTNPGLAEAYLAKNNISRSKQRFMHF